MVGVIAGGAFLYITRPVAQPTISIESATEHLSETTPNDSEDVKLFKIIPAKSYVEFRIDEVLRGNDFIAVGKTDQVTGEIAVNLKDLSQSQVGTISINARTFKTDDERRDGAIGRAILRSEDPANEFITFTPTFLKAPAESVMENKETNIEIVGDLKIAGITNQATFSGKVLLASSGSLKGSADAIVKRSDFNLIIPQVPFVASVSDLVTLKISFEAELAN